jgi:hemerythrin-like domain-containing protein
MEPATDLAPGTPRHPLTVLIDEHRVILSVLDDLERESLALGQGKPLRPRFWQRVLQFHAEFADGLHHHREEHLLFPALERVGLSPTTGPTAVLRAEHDRGRQWRQRIQQALDAGDLVRLQAACSSFIDFERQHIQKENQILFPLADRLLQLQQTQELAHAFAEIDGVTDPVADDGWPL